MYTLRNNVYMIKGYKNACLYDLNKGYLYHINMDLYNWIDKLIIYSIEADNLSVEEADALSVLLEQQLIEFATEKKEIKKNPKIEPKIEFAWIEITTKCNLRCIHCYEESDISCTKEMSFQDFQLVLQQLKELGIKSIQLIGGEPLLLGNKLREMVSLAVDNFSSVEVFTNGTMLDETWAEFFSKTRVKVALSVYSYDQKEHDKVTKMRGSHELTNNAIRLLKNHGVKYRVCNVLMNSVELGEKNTDLYSLSEKRDIVRMAGRANVQLLSRELIRKKLITEEHFSYTINPQLFYRLCSEHNCFGSKLYIASDLNVYPCVMERRISHGCVRNSSLKAVLKNSILMMNKDFIEGCKDCEYRYACFDCRANSMTNNVNEKPWYCTYNPYLGEWEEPEQFIGKILGGI